MLWRLVKQLIILWFLTDGTQATKFRSSFTLPPTSSTLLIITICSFFSVCQFSDHTLRCFEEGTSHVQAPPWLVVRPSNPPQEDFILQMWGSFQLWCPALLGEWRGGRPACWHCSGRCGSCIPLLAISPHSDSWTGSLKQWMTCAHSHWQRIVQVMVIAPTSCLGSFLSSCCRGAGASLFYQREIIAVCCSFFFENWHHAVRQRMVRWHMQSARKSSVHKIHLVYHWWICKVNCTTHPSLKSCCFASLLHDLSLFLIRYYMEEQLALFQDHSARYTVHIPRFKWSHGDI